MASPEAPRAAGEPRQAIDLDAPLPDAAAVLANALSAWRLYRARRCAEPRAFDAEAWLHASLQGLRLALQARALPLAAQCAGEALALAEGMAAAASWGGGRLRVTLHDAVTLNCALRPLRPGLWLGALQAASLAGAAGPLQRLAGMPVYALPDNEGERLQLAAAVAWGALALQQPDAARAIAEADALAIEPHERALVRALADIANGRAVAVPPVDAAAAAAAGEDVDGATLHRWLACEALAASLGAPLSDAARAWLGGLAVQVPAVVCTAPRRLAPLPDEPMWWLDLHAGAGERAHRLQADAQGRTLARYRVTPPAGDGPVVEVDFVLDGQVDTATEPAAEADAAPPLDAGELLHLADCYAATIDLQAEADAPALRRQRVAADIAVAAVDAALGRLPADRAPGDADFPSVLGRTRWRVEPERLNHLRLLAARQARAEVLAEIDRRLAKCEAAPAGDAGAASPAARPDSAAATASGSAPASDAQARHAALASAALLRQHLEPLLRALGQDRDGRRTDSLRPRPDDYARAFVPAVADAARQRYEALWADPPRLRPADAASRVVSHVAPAGLLGSDNELSWHFPGGYRGIAAWLDPHRVWVAWKLIPPGQDAGMAYDGLVWLDDHWAWFPKPYRVLAGLALSR